MQLEAIGKLAYDVQATYRTALGEEVPLYVNLKPEHQALLTAVARLVQAGKLVDNPAENFHPTEKQIHAELTSEEVNVALGGDPESASRETIVAAALFAAVARGCRSFVG